MLPRLQPRNVTEAMNLLNRTCWLSGLRTLSRDGSGRLGSFLASFYLALPFATFCSGFFTGAFVWPHRVPLQLADIVSFLSTRCSILVVFCHVVLGVCYSGAFHGCLKRLTIVDGSLERLGSRTRCRSTYLQSLCCITFVLVTVAVRIVIYCYRQGPVLGLSYANLLYFGILRCYSEILGSLVAISFAVTVFTVRDRFQRVNVLLKDIKTDQSDSPRQHLAAFRKGVNRTSITTLMVSCMKTIRWQKRNQLIQIVRHVHLELIAISKNLGKVFGLQLAVELSKSVIMIVVVLYSLYSQPKLLVMREFMLPLFTCVLHVMKVVLVNTASTRAVEEANKTIEIIHGMGTSVSDPDVKEEIRQFSLQMLLVPLNFSAFGFFSLDYRFMRSILGGVSTNFVILIQIGDSINNSKEIKFLSGNTTSQS